MKSNLFRFLSFTLVLIGFFFSVGVVSAQSCPHPACGAPGLPCCYGSVSVDEITSCRKIGGSGLAGTYCDPGYTLSQQPCDPGTCQTDPICSSNDGCNVTTDPTSGFVTDCSVPSAGSCSPATCCGFGVIPSTPTPGSTSTPAPPINTPTPVPCQVTTNPASIGLTVGGSGLPVTASVTSGLGGATVTNMAFGSYNTSIATVNPLNDATSIYTTTVSPVASGSTAVWGTATLSDGRTCQSTAATDTDVNVTTASCTITLSGRPKDITDLKKLQQKKIRR